MSVPRRNPAPTPTPAPPASPEEAEARYWKRYGWALTINLLGDQAPAVRPVTVEQWIALATRTRDALQAPLALRLAGVLEQAARQLRAASEGDDA